MRIYKRGDTWYLDYYIPGKKGEERRREAAGKNRKVAEQLMTKRQTEILEGKFGIERPEVLTFAELLDRFFETSAKTIKPMTLKRYRVSSNQLLPYFGEQAVGKITVYEIEKYRQERTKVRNVATINRDMAFMRRLFNVARKWNLVQKNPVEEIDFFREDNIRTRFYTIEEVKQLLECCLPQAHLHLAVTIALNTGMRKGEIMSLVIPGPDDNLDKINWIDLGNRCFHLNITKSSKYRRVPINKSLLPLIEAAIMDREPGNLFPHKDVRYSFLTALKNAGIKNGNFHDLRRTFISHAMMAGYSQEVIQRVVGQDDPGIFKRYAHLAPDLQKQVVNDMGVMFMSSSPVKVLGMVKKLPGTYQAQPLN